MQQEIRAFRLRRGSQIVEAATNLFCRKGILDTTIEEVAKAAGVGTATVYRYYHKKSELTIQCALWYWQQMEERYLPLIQTDKYKKKTGIEKLEHIMSFFVWGFRQDREFLKFLHEFDVYVQKSEIDPEVLKEYEEYILGLKNYVTEAIEEGIADGTIRSEATIDEIYFSAIHTMLSLAQKMAALGDVSNAEGTVQGEHQIELVKDLLLRGLASGGE
jgi:AcrR family transcriptional regulator